LNWLSVIGLLISFVFSVLAAVKGVREIKNKENSFIYNLIAIIGSTLILMFFIFWAVLIISLYFNGLSNQD